MTLILAPGQRVDFGCDLGDDHAAVRAMPPDGQTLHAGPAADPRLAAGAVPDGAAFGHARLGAVTSGAGRADPVDFGSNVGRFSPPSPLGAGEIGSIIRPRIRLPWVAARAARATGVPKMAAELPPKEGETAHGAADDRRESAVASPATTNAPKGGDDAFEKVAGADAPLAQLLRNGLPQLMPAPDPQRPRPLPPKAAQAASDVAGQGATAAPDRPAISVADLASAQTRGKDSDRAAYMSLDSDDFKPLPPQVSLASTRRVDWIMAGFSALIAGGISAVRIEPIARKLMVPRGSFYWHFSDLTALHLEMLTIWEGLATAQITNLAPDLAPEDALYALCGRLSTLPEAEVGQTPLESRLRDWGRVASIARQAVLRVDRRRLLALGDLFTAAGHSPDAAARAAAMLYAALIGLEDLRASTGLAMRDPLIATAKAALRAG